ncbi:hypothetical protein [Chitinophaga vietnamensis]|uniref:hypothetical protein n=1 Tax=Chitinophaga vietnamensis TaxID=2593957 RepID=UPI00117832A2|nr:hypothetical protein [Chitinophaga vietnamensis]
MKKLLSFLAAALLICFAMFFLFNVKHADASKRRVYNIFYCLKTAGGNYTYSSTPPGFPIACHANNANTSCQIETNISLSTLNSSYAATFPVDNSAYKPDTDPSWTKWIGGIYEIYQ